MYHHEIQSNLDEFPSLETFIVSDNNHTTMICKIFSHLAAINLQSGVAELKSKLNARDYEDYGKYQRREPNGMAILQSFQDWGAYNATDRQTG